jgi:hypothetical protein
MKTVSINAFGCHPRHGSERGLGWIWVKALSNKFKIICYTEIDSKDEIEKFSEIPNVKFVYINISTIGRKAIYNQGNYFGYLFYCYYQWIVFFKGLFNARTDYYHHLNMIGYRVPGLFWLLSIIKNSHSIWGPIGGTNLIPFSAYRGYGFKTVFKSNLKNIVNVINIFMPNVLLANIFYNKRVFVQKNFLSTLMISSNYYPETFIRDQSTRERTREYDFAIVGKLTHRKNHILAFDSLINSNLEKSKIVVIGDGVLMQNLKRYTKLRGINVKFTGNLEREKVVEYLKNTKVLIIASVDEGTSHAVVEAISQGCRIAGYKIGGHSRFQDEHLKDVTFFDTYKELVIKLSASIRSAISSNITVNNLNYSPEEFGDQFYKVP